jgi:large subunit ribosomal protein L6
MSNLVRANIYKPQILFFEMQQFGQTFICWFSGSYNTYRVTFFNYFPIEILPQHFRFKQFVTQIAASFYRTASSSHLQMLHQKMSLLHVHMNQWIVGNIVGFQNALRIRGVGYRFEISPLKITIHAGYSHLLSQKFSVTSPFRSFMLNKKTTQIFFKGPHLMSLNLYASTIRNLRQPDVYKGKGLRYQKDFVKRKEGKKKKIS